MFHGSVFCDPTTLQISDTIQSTDHKQNTDPTRPAQLMMTPKVEFLKYSFNINRLLNLYFNKMLSYRRETALQGAL